MPTVPIRGVGEVGTLPDLNPQDAPLTAWTNARNMRFAENNVSRYSVFKTVNSTYSYSKVPVGVFNGHSNGDGYLVTVFNDGSMQQLNNAVVTNVTPTGVTAGGPDQITHCTLGGVTYVNVFGAGPFYRTQPGLGAFKALPAWGSSDRCYSLRSYRDFLIAINVTKSGIDYGGMIKWSNAAQYGSPPADWNVTDPASLAGETVINDLRGTLTDGFPMGDSFIVYGQNQTFRMDYIGTPFIFRINKLFDDQGVMARNCVAEVEGKHYVFGKTDIYVHDGVSKQSLAQNRVSKTIFEELDYSQIDKCFVYHDRTNGEVAFCYPSTDDGCIWPLNQITGCNKAAVYNYRFNTWTFVDLPSLVGATEVLLVSSANWDNFGGWNKTPQTWAAFTSTKPQNLLVASSGNSSISKAGKPYFLDNLFRGRLPNEVDFDIAWPAYAETVFRDLDEIGANLYGRKIVTRVVPQYRVWNTDDEMTFQLGQSKYPSGDITWGQEKTFTGYSQDKYDTRINGRYLSIRLGIPAGNYAEFSGYDVDIQTISGR